jgi:hypothetical protein
MGPPLECVSCGGSAKTAAKQVNYYTSQPQPVFSGANPTIVRYNASVVNFYNATGSLVRFENKNIIFYF